ncbi:MAG: MFS transporter [Microlunatus sp.]
MRPPTRPTLLLHRDIALVWTSGLISMTGSLAMFVALPVAVFDTTDSVWATAMTALAGIAPTALVGQVAGVVADWVDRRRLLVATNLSLAALTCVYLALPDGQWWLFAALNLLVASVAQFAGPAEHALLGDLVPKARLGEGASLNALNNNIARLVGPALGGLMFAKLGFWATVVLDAATFIMAAVLLWLVTSQNSRLIASRAPTDRWVAAWLEGACRVWSHSQLRPIVALAALLMLGEGAISALIAPFTREVLNGGAEVLGLMFTAQAVGGIAGAAWTARNADRMPPLRLLGAGALASGLLMVVIFNYAFIYPQSWPAVVLTGLAGFPFAVVGAAQGYALQIYAPPELRGRVYSLASGTLSLAQLAGIVLAGAAGERWGPIAINIDTAAYLTAGVAAFWLAHRPATDGPGPSVRSDHGQ